MNKKLHSAKMNKKLRSRRIMLLPSQAVFLLENGLTLNQEEEQQPVKSSTQELDF